MCSGCVACRVTNSFVQICLVKVMTVLTQNARVLLSLTLVLGSACVADEYKRNAAWLPSNISDSKQIIIVTEPPPPTSMKEYIYDRLVLIQHLYKPGYLHVHRELCPEGGANIKLLILIMSAPDHWIQRYGIRMTWGHYGRRSDVVIAFFLGRPSDDIMKKVREEDRFYEDIIMGAFWDSYSNVTLKVLSMLDWITTYCPLAQKFLKCDDDMFINVPLLLDFISNPTRINATKTIWGKVVRNNIPDRSPTGKNYISYMQYPFQVLPTFTAGPAYLMTSDAVPALRAARSTNLCKPYVWLEDMFITGMLADESGVHREHAEEFYNNYDREMPHPCLVQRSISIHAVEYHDLFEMWSMQLDGQTWCH